MPLTYIAGYSQCEPACIKYNEVEGKVWQYEIHIILSYVYHTVTSLSKGFLVVFSFSLF